MTLTGPLTDLNSFLAQSSGLIYQSDASYHGFDTVTFAVDDGAGLANSVGDEFKVPFVVVPKIVAPQISFPTQVTFPEIAPLHSPASR